MNTTNNGIEQSRVIFLDHPVVGITSPEFQEFANATINAIARATKRFARAVLAALSRAWSFVGRKLQEGAELHNRAQTNLDDRYARNWYYLRSMM